MQLSYGLYWRFLVGFGLFKRISRKCVPNGIIHAKETTFSIKRKVVKDD